jgi:hypothetical protein
MKDPKKAALYTLIAILTGLATIQKASAQQDVITTIAGGGPNGIPALNANANGPHYLRFDKQGNYYIAASNRVYKVSPAGLLTVVAGTGFAGYSGDGGPAVNAAVNGTWDVAVDAANPANVYISDNNNCLVRKVDQATGIITTVAGLVVHPETGAPYGSCGYSGDGGAANAAQLNQPAGLDVNPSTGDLYIAEYFNGRVRKVAGGAATGKITTVAGGGGSTSSANNCGGSSPYGDGAAANESYLCYPQSVALDTTVSPVNLAITEGSAGGRCTVRDVVGSSGKIYTVAGMINSCGFTDGVVATSGRLNNPNQVALSVSKGTSTLIVGDWFNDRVRQFTLTYSGGVPKPGTITTIAGSGNGGYCGDGGAALSACMSNTAGVAFDTSGDIYIGDDGNNRVRKVTKSSGDISTAVGWGYNGNTVTAYSDPVGIKGLPATGVSLYQFNAVSIDSGSGNLYIGGFNTPALYAMDLSSGTISDIAGNGIPGFAGDGAPNSASTQVNQPIGTARDSAGNLYFSENTNCVVREISASTGDIETIAGGTPGHLNGCGYSGNGGKATAAQISDNNFLAIDAKGNLYISEYGNCAIRKIVLSTGIISTVAGGNGCGYNGDGIPAVDAQLNRLDGVSLDGVGNIYISDFGNQRLRKVDAVTGIISTVAGSGSAGYTGDGLAIGNDLNTPQGATADANGNLFFGDTTNNLVRWVDPAGQLVTIAGESPTTPGGNYGFDGDGGPATEALMANPNSVARDVEGNLYVADYMNGRVRKITAFAGYGRSTASLDFSEVQQIGTTSGFEPVTLSAIGPVTIDGITVTAGFSEIDDCIGNQLAAGDTCEIDVYFSPTKSGPTTGMLTIASDAFFKNQGNTVDLVGEGGGLSIIGSLAFATQLINATETNTVTLKNTGNLVKLTSIAIADSADYTVTGGTCKAGNTLATNASCTIAVTFKSTSTGTKKGTLTVTSNDPASPLLAAITGTATELTLSPTSLTFGSVIDRETKTLDLTVTNSNGSFTISPTITGSGFTILTTGNTCTTAIAAGAKCTLPIQFAPFGVETYSGTLTLVNGDATSPTVALTGAGTTNISVSRSASPPLKRAPKKPPI